MGRSDRLSLDVCGRRHCPLPFAPTCLLLFGSRSGGWELGRAPATSVCDYRRATDPCLGALVVVIALVGRRPLPPASLTPDAVRPARGPPAPKGPPRPAGPRGNPRRGLHGLTTVLISPSVPDRPGVAFERAVGQGQKGAEGRRP